VFPAWQPFSVTYLTHRDKATQSNRANATIFSAYKFLRVTEQASIFHGDITDKSAKISQSDHATT
jgi:hypothetical protein